MAKPTDKLTKWDIFVCCYWAIASIEAIKIFSKIAFEMAKP